MSQDGAQVRSAVDGARDARRRGDRARALSLLYDATAKVNARSRDYNVALQELMSLFTELGHRSAALSVAWYLGDHKAERAIVASGGLPLHEIGRTVQAWAERDAQGSPQAYQQAATNYEQAGFIAHAAICREHAGDWKHAQALWARLAESIADDERQRYAAGLANFNVARAAKQLGDMAASRSAVVASVHHLEEAADRFERIGQRERSFDCYQVLIAIGKQTGEFEHVLEGYVNVVRILREDNLRYYALQSYEDVLHLAEQEREYSAGATLAREMAEYAHAQNLPKVANFGVEAQAELWEKVARATLERGGPKEVAENALLAAIVALARRGQFSKVGRLYEALAELDLEAARTEHYRRVRKRYEGVRDAELEASALPSHLRQDSEFPDVWHVDMIEWEQRGSASAACADVILQASQWSDLTRRRALYARLEALNAEAPGADPQLTVRMLQALSQVELYTILAPLERAFAHPNADVRHTVAKGLERFMYKRTFVTVRRALKDEDQAVRNQAYGALEALRFPHAFDPLARIYREFTDPSARIAALRALARVDTEQAAELLVGVFQHEHATEQAAVAEALKRSRATRFEAAARHAYGGLHDGAKAAISKIFTARGWRL